MKNEKGIALLTTLVLGLVAVVFIGALLYILSTGTRMSGIVARYTTSLEAAKGGADLVITKIINDDLKCNGGNVCTPCPDLPNANCKIDLQVSNLGSYNLTAYLIGEDTTTYAGTVYKIYAVRVIATKQDSEEKAEIEFVYKIE